uniref:Uncharacterized protein n=1 Tax=Arundo donax TaxID=35708 RepID=A0A0A9ASM5_ARUDO
MLPLDELMIHLLLVQ